jgi:hypothetical protein
MTVLILAAGALAEPPTAATVESFLAQMKVKAQQPSPGEFAFSLGFPDAKPEKFMVRALPQQKLVYLAILDVAHVAAKGATSEAQFRKLAELNYQLTVGKLEWEAATGGVRLSYTFANETGVDLKSFTAVLQTLLTEVGAARKALESAR